MRCHGIFHFEQDSLIDKSRFLDGKSLVFLAVADLMRLVDVCVSQLVKTVDDFPDHRVQVVQGPPT